MSDVIPTKWVREVMLKMAVDDFIAKSTFKNMTKVINRAMDYYKYHANTQ
jgi:hypothetical protein